MSDCIHHSVFVSSSISLTLISIFFVCTGMITRKGDSDVVGAATTTTNEREQDDDAMYR